jgi:hypothetical protein
MLLRHEGMYLAVACYTDPFGGFAGASWLAAGNRRGPGLQAVALPMTPAAPVTIIVFPSIGLLLLGFHHRARSVRGCPAMV